MAEDIDYALIQFINSRPEGNELRDIAIRTLKDRRKIYKVKYLPPRTNSHKSTKAKSLFLQKRCIRILPSIGYKNIKACGHNYKVK